MVKEVESEVPYQIRRFDSPSSMVRWRMALSVIDDFLRTEPEAMVKLIVLTSNYPCETIKVPIILSRSEVVLGIKSGIFIFSTTQ